MDRDSTMKRIASIRLNHNPICAASLAFSLAQQLGQNVQVSADTEGLSDLVMGLPVVRNLRFLSKVL